jgi:hypothetical protein
MAAAHGAIRGDDRKYLIYKISCISAASGRISWRIIYRIGRSGFVGAGKK